MDQAGLHSAPSSAHDDVPPPHTPLRKLPAPALSQLRRFPMQEVSPDLCQQSQLLSQRLSQQFKTQGQQPSSSREHTDSMTVLEMLSDLHQNGWLSSQMNELCSAPERLSDDDGQCPSRQSETQGQSSPSSCERTDPKTVLEASNNLRQNGSPLSQHPSRQSETQGQQPSSSRERTGPMMALEALNNLPQNGSPLSQHPSRQHSAAYDSFTAVPRPSLGLQNYDISIASVKTRQVASIPTATASFGAFTVSAFVRAFPCGTIGSLGFLTRN
ncbi:hypothetical protein B0H19DRAFT_1261373 [Mycena capillaripes]|nr:hypothetical protein B0H19DRAFT_1261373 [Mycena capillaripes]